MNLTPTKIYGCRLPDKSKRIGKNGHTSLVYTTDDPTKLEVYTVEVMKIYWWYEGLKITPDWDEVGEAHYYGYKRSYYYSEPKFEWIKTPVYRCIVERLEMPNKEQRKYIRKLWKSIDDLRLSWYTKKYKDNRVYLTDFWNILLDNSSIYPELEKPSMFIQNYDSDNVYPDLDPNDWGVYKGELVCFDPYHHKDITRILNLAGAWYGH